MQKLHANAEADVEIDCAGRVRWDWTLSWNGKMQNRASDSTVLGWIGYKLFWLKCDDGKRDF